jgi:hypothetical protein
MQKRVYGSVTLEQVPECFDYTSYIRYRCGKEKVI